MKWPWTQREDDRDPDEAKRARDDAERNLREARDQWPEVRRVSESLRESVRQNHFGEAIEAIFKGAR